MHFSVPTRLAVISCVDLNVPTAPQAFSKSVERILLVDRSDDLRCFVQGCVQSNGYADWAIDHARTGAEAVRLLNRTHRLAIVGTVQTGYEPLSASLRSMRTLHSVQVINMHAWPPSPDWCDAALQHPFTEADVHRVLDRLLTHE